MDIMNMFMVCYVLLPPWSFCHLCDYILEIYVSAPDHEIIMLEYLFCFIMLLYEEYKDLCMHSCDK